MNLLILNLKMDADDGVLGFTTAWVNALARQCERVTVITNEAGAVRVEPNVTVISLGREQGRSRLRRLFVFYGALWRTLRAEQIDGCFAHMNYLFALMGAPVLKAFRVPTVLWYAHGATPTLLRVAAWTADRIVTSSRSGFRLPSRKLRVVGQGIDTDQFRPSAQQRHGEAEPLRLLTLGRISRVKRNEMALEALARLRATAPQLRFTLDFVGEPITGDGETYLDELRRRCEALGVGNVVRFRGGVPFAAAPAALQQADAFVNSGDTDSVDKAVLEAMSCALPVVTSNAAFAEILPDGLRSAVIAKDDVAALAGALERLAEMGAAERAKIGEAGRAFVMEHHSLAGLTLRLMAELREVARRPATRAEAPSLAV